MLRTFAIHTLGCKVNAYESEQVRLLLQRHGLTETSAALADLRIVNSCSVTLDAASQSRQATRRSMRLPVLSPTTATSTASVGISRKTIVMGCWATEDPSAATMIGVDAVITHQQRLNDELPRLLAQWRDDDLPHDHAVHALPIAGQPQGGRQRAVMKVQDGCDASCTYCIIPRLRPKLWSKDIDEAVREAQSLVDAGHLEIVLSGIFLGAYGHETALRRRQARRGKGQAPLATLVDALCTRVSGLRRLRLSSLEPGDVDDSLLSVLRRHRQVAPHFHLPLQSGSELVLRQMNRQYTRDDYLRLVERLQAAFDRPALTTDIIVGFPGEDDAEFEQTLAVARTCGFMHIHAFAYSPRPRTAAARWSDRQTPQWVAKERLRRLTEVSRAQNLRYRQSFLGHIVEVIVESARRPESSAHGRCERYFSVTVEGATFSPGTTVNVRLIHVDDETSVGRAAPSSASLPSVRLGVSVEGSSAGTSDCAADGVAQGPHL